MSNDTALNQMSGGDEMATYDTGPHKFPAGYIAFGDVSAVPVVAPQIVSNANPLPVSIKSPLGQAAMAASIPVVIASDQTLVLAGGQFNTSTPSLSNAQTAALQLNGRGALLADLSSVRNAYALAVVQGTAISGVDPEGDIFTIFGATGKVIRVLYLSIQPITNNSTSYVQNFFIKKRSSVDTGGNPQTAAGVPFDSQASPASATVTYYNINSTSQVATTGTEVGNLAFYQLTITSASPQTTSLLTPPIAIFDLTKPGTLPWVLRSASEGICVNKNVSTQTNCFVSINIIWTEDVV